MNEIGRWPEAALNTWLVARDAWVHAPCVMRRRRPAAEQEIHDVIRVDDAKKFIYYDERRADFRPHDAPPLEVRETGDGGFEVDGARANRRDLRDAGRHRIGEAGGFTIEAHHREMLGWIGDSDERRDLSMGRRP